MTAVGGVGLASGIFFSFRAYRLSQSQQITDRYAKAVEQLSAKTEGVRIGSIYALERIMRDSPEDQSTVIEVLCAYVRSMTKINNRDEWYAVIQERPSYDEYVKTHPNGDIQTALTVIGRRAPVASEFPLDLERCDLRGADLSNANLQGAHLNGTLLAGADFDGADLAGAHLDGTLITIDALSRLKLTGIFDTENVTWVEEPRSPLERFK